MDKLNKEHPSKMADAYEFFFVWSFKNNICFRVNENGRFLDKMSASEILTVTNTNFEHQQLSTAVRNGTCSDDKTISVTFSVTTNKVVVYSLLVKYLNDTVKPCLTEMITKIIQRKLLELVVNHRIGNKITIPTTVSQQQINNMYNMLFNNEKESIVKKSLEYENKSKNNNLYHKILII